MTGLADAVHHPVGADGDDAVNIFQIDGLLAQTSFGIGDHRLNDIAAKMRVLRPVGSDLVAKVGRPDDLVSRVFDLFAFEEVGTVLVPGKIDDLIVLLSAMPERSRTKLRCRDRRPPAGRSHFR